MTGSSGLQNLKNSVDDLKHAMANNHGNIPAKALTVKRLLAEEIATSPLKDQYLEIYDDCFPYGGSPNIDLLDELANGGITKRLPLTGKYWSSKLEEALGL
jgi:hypothetical protein